MSFVRNSGDPESDCWCSPAIEHRKVNNIIYVKFQEIGSDNSSEEAGEQNMIIKCSGACGAKCLTKEKFL